MKYRPIILVNSTLSYIILYNSFPNSSLFISSILINNTLLRKGVKTQKGKSEEALRKRKAPLHSSS